jgi:hypothetical protein
MIILNEIRIHSQQILNNDIIFKVIFKSKDYNTNFSTWK